MLGIKELENAWNQTAPLGYILSAYLIWKLITNDLFWK